MKSKATSQGTENAWYTSGEVTHISSHSWQNHDAGVEKVWWDQLQLCGGKFKDVKRPVC